MRRIDTTVGKSQENKERLFDLIMKAQSRNRKVKPEVIEREVAEAVRSVRARPSR